MPTVIGVIFFCLGVYCFFWREDALLGLLLIASVFGAASAVNIGDRGIHPYYIVGGFIIAKAMINWLLRGRMKSDMPEAKWLLAFGAIGVASAFLLPRIFAGLPVYDSSIGIDDGLFIRPPLKFGPHNVIQATFLLWHIAIAYSTLGIRFSAAKTRRAYLLAFYFVVLFIFAQALSQFLGFSLPDSLIRNNPGYTMAGVERSSTGIRNPGTFPEASMAGLFLLTYYIAFMTRFLSGKGNTLNVIVSFVAIVLVSSSGSMLALFVFTLALILRYSPFRLPWYVNLKRMKRQVLLLLLVITPLAAAMAFPTYRERLLSLTVSKGETGSFISRTAADLYALWLFSQTYGLGVGLGSNRASSLMTTLLSNLGALGFLAFCVFYFKLFAKLKGERAWLKWSALALLFNMCLDVPDITLPTLWISILLAIQFITNRGEWTPSEALHLPASTAVRFLRPKTVLTASAKSPFTRTVPKPQA